MSNTPQTVAVLQHHGSPVTTPASGLSETVLAGRDVLSQLMHLPPEVVELDQLGVDVHLSMVAAIGLGLVDGVDAGHGGIALDIGNPDRSDLLEAHSESNLVDGASINKVDVQAEKLLLRYVVPSDAGQVPGSVDEAIFLDGE